MLTILDLGPNVLAYGVEGRLGRDDIERLHAEADRKLETGQKIRIYAEVHTLSGIGLDALWQDLRLVIERWRAITQIEKAALVTDLQWLRRVALVKDTVFRGIQIRTFPLAGQAEARAWVQD